VYAQSARQATNNKTSGSGGLLLPTIFEPAHRMMLSQKMYMTIGVPNVANDKKAVDRVVRIEPMIATSDLNQRFKRRTMKNAARVPNRIDGSLIE
jgi:hypothetical protein